MIQIENVCKKYGDKVLLNDFNLEIPDGRFVVISGNSGCGKSTLLNMIGGIEKCDKGSIVVDGFCVTGKRNKRVYFRDTVGFLFQNFALLENKTVKQNLSIIRKDGRSEITIEEAVRKVGLLDAMNKKVYQLSGGEQQRIALARLMIKKCSVILADEPTGALDEYNTKIVMNILHELNDMGKTILLVTHNQKIVEEEEYVIKL